MNEKCHGLADEAISILILAGGQSRRMGQDKAALAWENGDLLSSLLTRLQPLSDDIIVSTNIIRELPSGITAVADIIPGKGPLSGIHAGLQAARHEVVFVTACDVPFLVPAMAVKLLQGLGRADAAVAVQHGKIEPLFACYRRRVGAIAAELLVAEQYRVTALLERIAWQGIEFTEEYTACFMNVNTSQEYEQAKQCLAKGR